MTEIFLITLAIIFLLLAINKLKNTLLEQDNHLMKMQRYLQDCEKEKQNNDFMDFINEIETYEKLMQEKNYR